MKTLLSSLVISQSAYPITINNSLDYSYALFRMR